MLNVIHLSTAYHHLYILFLKIKNKKYNMNVMVKKEWIENTAHTMTRKGRGVVMVLLKKRTLLSVFGALILALGAVCALYISRDKPAMSTVRPLPSAEILVLDAGHGGEDGGAVSAAGVPESHINLQIVQKMEQLFTFVGESAALTRTGPDAIYSGDAKTLREKKISDLNNRVEMINETPRGFLISIHQNSLPGTKARGAQVFYNAVAPAKDAAVSVQQALNSGINGNNRKNAKQIDESIFLMNNIQRPGILVECGFLSHAEEAEILQTDSHQLRLSTAIVSGYLQSRTENE